MDRDEVKVGDKSENAAQNLLKQKIAEAILPKTSELTVKFANLNFQIMKQLKTLITSKTSLKLIEQHTTEWKFNNKLNTKVHQNK